MRWWVIALLGLWGLVLVYLLAVAQRRHAASLPPPPPSLDVTNTGGLAFEITVERTGRERRIELVSPSGAATLVLGDPEGSEFVSFGEGRFEPGDRAAGEGFVSDVARWLGRPVPAVPRAQTELAPFPVSYAYLGDEEGWDANKLFLEYGHRYAEVYLNLEEGATSAILLGKDEEYSDDLLALLAIALRDGRPPPRATATDPNFATDAPLVPALRPLAYEGRPDVATWTARGAVGVLGNRPAQVVLWTTPDALPTRLATLEGVVHALVASPDGARVAVVLVRPEEPDHYSFEDPGELIVIEVATGWRRTIARPLRAASSSQVAFSPDGARIAFSVPDEDVANLARVFDAATGSVVGATDREHDLAIDTWTDEGLILHRGDWDEDDNWVGIYFRWTPGEEPQRIDAPESPRSPDGRYTLVPLAGGSLRVRGPEGVRTFESADEGDRAFFATLAEYEPEWCGPDRLVIRGPDPLALDLRTLKLQQLFPGRGWTFVAADAPGRRVLALDAGGALHWGEVR